MSIISLKLERKNGIQRGRFERKKGTEEKNGEKKKSIEIAKEMLKKGMAVDLICEITKLSRKEIERIK